MTKLLLPVMCLFLFACSQESGGARDKALPSTEKKDPYEILFDAPLVRGINFSVSVDSLSNWPNIRELDHSTFIIVDSVDHELFIERTHIHHNDQYIQKIETWLEPGGDPSGVMFEEVNELLTKKYGEGQGEFPYKVWILEHEGRPLIELSVEIVEGSDGNRLKVSYFLRQYI